MLNQVEIGKSRHKRNSPPKKESAPVEEPGRRGEEGPSSARAERRAGEAIGVQVLFGDLDGESRRNLGTRLRDLGRLRRAEEELHEVHEDVGDHHGGE